MLSAANGTFGAQAHTAPETYIARPQTITVVTRVQTSGQRAVPYPADIPEGGKVTADLEDDNGVYLTIEFPGNVTVSYGCPDPYSEWNSIAADGQVFDTDTDEAIIEYLRNVHMHVDWNATELRHRAYSAEVLDAFVDQATGVQEDTSEQEQAHARGKKLTGAYGDPNADIEEQATDALADILMYARSEGLDIDELVNRAKSYTELN